jgi:hypothetical protein
MGSLRADRFLYYIQYMGNILCGPPSRKVSSPLYTRARIVRTVRTPHPSPQKKRSAYKVSILDIKRHIESTSVDSIELFRFMKCIPRAVNYVILVGHYKGIEYYHKFYRSNRTIADHVTTDGLTNKCQILLNERQYKMVNDLFKLS